MAFCDSDCCPLAKVCCALVQTPEDFLEQVGNGLAYLPLNTGSLFSTGALTLFTIFVCVLASYPYLCGYAKVLDLDFLIAF